ncbi:MAG: hypothetical protein ABFC96_14175, partial [Thermoguttaceae bacterium]
MNDRIDQGPIEVLLASAADSCLSVVSYDVNSLVLYVDVDAAGGRRAIIQIRRPIHVDLPPTTMLETLQIGAASLLPEGYLQARDRGD